MRLSQIWRSCATWAASRYAPKSGCDRRQVRPWSWLRVCDIQRASDRSSKSRKTRLYSSHSRSRSESDELLIAKSMEFGGESSKSKMAKSDSGECQMPNDQCARLAAVLCFRGKRERAKRKTFNVQRSTSN